MNLLLHFLRYYKPFSTIRHADLIMVVEGGRIVERGTYAELLGADGAYAYFYNLQFGGRSI